MATSESGLNNGGERSFGVTRPPRSNNRRPSSHVAKGFRAGSGRVLGHGGSLNDRHTSHRHLHRNPMWGGLMDVLVGAATTGWWSRFGDLRGRKIILCFSMVGIVLMDLSHVLATATNLRVIPALTFVITGAILQGILGDLPTLIGAALAYASDCTYGSRSTSFAVIQGAAIAGMGAGGYLGGLIHSGTSGNLLLIFLSSAALALVNLFLVSYALPESLDRGIRLDPEDTDPPSPIWTPRAMLSGLAQILRTVPAPVTMFAPRMVTDQQRSRKGWYLSFLSSALFVYALSTGIDVARFLYATVVYQGSIWTSWLLYITAVFVPLIVLLIVLPTIASFLKTKLWASAGRDAALTKEEISAEMTFDKLVALYLLAAAALAEVLLAVFPASIKALFLVFSCLAAISTGAYPVIMSLGAVHLVSIDRSSEMQSLLGAMAALASVAEWISPKIFYLLYRSTYYKFPKAVFCLAGICVVVAVALLSFLQTDDVDATRDPLHGVSDADATDAVSEGEGRGGENLADETVSPLVET